MSATRRAILERLAAEPHTGPELADECGISRVAVWKHVETLREQGFEIESSPDGYRLEAIPEFEEAALTLGLEAPYDVQYRERVESTNDVARSLATEGAEDVVVVAEQQTAGRGRMGRSWSSEPGGVYLSALVRPAMAPRDVPLLTLAAAVATADTIAAMGVAPEIKWPNDVMIGSKKVAGILTEMEGEPDRVRWVVVGIGVNANTDVTRLPAGATSLRAETGDTVDRRRLVQAIIEAFERYRRAPEDVLPAWRAYARTLGRRVRVTTGGDEIVGRAVDIVHPGSLTIDTPDGEVTVHAGDCEHLRPDP